MNVLPPLVCKFHQGQCLPFPILNPNLPLLSQLRLLKLDLLNFRRIWVACKGLPWVRNWEAFQISISVLVSNHYIYDWFPQNKLLLSGPGLTLPRAAGAFIPGFAGGGLQDENAKLPHGVSTTSLGTSLQPGGSKETLPSPPATPAANTTAYTPPTSVVKALDAFHVTSPPQAAPPNDSMSVATENDSAENVEPVLPDNQLGLSPSQLPGSSPEPVPPKKRVPSDPPPPTQGPPPEAPKGQGSSQDLRVSGAVPGEGSGEGPEKEGKKTGKNKYKDGTYWKSCTQRLKAMNRTCILYIPC